MNFMENILTQFNIRGKIIQIEKYGKGQINDTYLVITNLEKYVLQKINEKVFTDIPLIMQNIEMVLSYSKKMYGEMSLVCTKDRKTYYVDSKKQYWRIYRFVENSYYLNAVNSPQNAYSYGQSLGMFVNEFFEFPQDKLHDTFPEFHNTMYRYNQFEKSIQEDKLNRALYVSQEIDFIRKRREEIEQNIIIKESNIIPKSVSHNDMKIDNIVFSKTNDKPICIVDLDTIMPGFIADDFGDAFRFAVTYSTEDTKDLGEVYIVSELFESYVKGFWSRCWEILTKAEKEMLLEQCKMMTLECGMRMLTDYICGDIYFPINYTEHNYIRSRTRIKLVQEIEKQWDKWANIIESI